MESILYIVTIYTYKDMCVILLFFFSLLWFPLSSYDDNSEEYVLDDATINSLQPVLNSVEFFFFSLYVDFKPRQSIQSEIINFLMNVTFYLF